MRRWLELGYQGNIFDETLIIYERPEGEWHISTQTGETSGTGSPIFISMPFKATLVQFFQELMPGNGNLDYRGILVYLKDQGVDPDPACLALHVPRSYSFAGNGGPRFGIPPWAWWWAGVDRFEKSGAAAGFTPGLFAINTEPPSANG